MGFSLFPKPAKFHDLFASQNRKMQEASTALCGVLAAVEKAPAQCAQINQLEVEGNGISREISRQLALTFITPIDREDIHAINVAEEDVLNLIKAISVRLGLYDFKGTTSAAKDLVANLHSMIQMTGEMLAKLEARQEVGEISVRVQQVKTESDLLLTVAMGEVYESQLTGPEAVLNVVKWTQIYDRIEQALARVESLAGIIEGISLKNA